MQWVHEYEGFGPNKNRQSEIALAVRNPRSVGQSWLRTNLSQFSHFVVAWGHHSKAPGQGVDSMGNFLREFKSKMCIAWVL